MNQELDLILKYFPNLNDHQKEQFTALGNLYREWNQKINVISRKDMDAFYTHHVLHSLGIARVMSFQPGTWVLDVGTGGGFPGIPLAIMLSEIPSGRLHWQKNRSGKRCDQSPPPL